MNSEFRRIWKEAVAALSRYCPEMCLRGLRRTTKNLIQDNRCLIRGSNLVSLMGLVLLLDQPVQCIHIRYIIEVNIMSPSLLNILRELWKRLLKFAR
jgi:hypothetical protein